MTVELTLRMSREDAEKLVRTWEEGKLDHLNITDIRPKEPESPQPPSREWAEDEAVRRKMTKQKDVPPRG